MKREGPFIDFIVFLGYGAVAMGAVVSAAHMLKKTAETETDHTKSKDDHSIGTTFRYAFSKTGTSPQKQLATVIDNAKETIDAAVYVITNTTIVTHLCKANKRGVKVRIITDKNDDFQKEAMEKLADSGIPIKVNTYEGLMHLKNMIVDRKQITTGSYNFTNKAEKQNEEVVIIAENNRVAEEWSDKFDEMWNDDINYVPYQVRGASRLA